MRNVELYYSSSDIQTIKMNDILTLCVVTWYEGYVWTRDAFMYVISMSFQNIVESVYAVRIVMEKIMRKYWGTRKAGKAPAVPVPE